MMWEELKMGAILTTMELMDVVGNTLIKAAKNKDNIRNLVFIVYSHGLGSLFLAPAAFLFYRKMPAPNLTCSIFLKLLLLTCLSYVCVLSMYIGLGYASPTLASAMGNLYPAYTFILAIVFRMETVNLRVLSSLLKAIGTLVTICGAFIVTFYEGVPINLHISSKSPFRLQASSLAADWVIGGFFLALSNLVFACLAIIKTWIMRDYPSGLLVMLIIFSVETILAAIVALILEDPSTWRLSFDIELLAIIYAAIMVVGVVSTVQCWAYHKKGPVYVAMFKPLQMIIAAVLGVAFLRDTLYLGSVIGGATIAVGFYTVMQGKAREIEKDSDRGISNFGHSPDEAPLLANKNINP